MNYEQLVDECKKMNLELTPSVIEKLRIYAQLLQEWNQKMNLTAITDTQGIIEKHFLDCMIPLSKVQLSGRIADVGSGAGFPGMIFALMLPEAQLTLIEPTGKKCQFLNTVKDQLSIDNVTIVNARAEEYAVDHRESFDAVCARAVASLPVLSELCVPLVKTGGIFLAMKGPQAQDEVSEAKHAAQVLGCSTPQLFEAVLPDGEKRVNVVYQKVSKTPLAYPRNYGRIKKKPL